MLGPLLRLHRSLDLFQRLILIWMLGLTLGVGVMLWSAQVDRDRALAAQQVDQERELAAQQASRERALAQMADDVTRCFLSPGRVSKSVAAYCAARFDDPATPDNDYRTVQASSAGTLGQFRELIRRVERLERLERLEARQ